MAAVCELGGLLKAVSNSGKFQLGSELKDLVSSSARRERKMASILLLNQIKLLCPVCS